MQRMSLIALIVAVIALAAAAPATYAGLVEQGRTKTLEFEVSEDMTRFVFDKDVVYDDGLPADGSAFITRGYLYEPGTLTCDTDGKCNGVNTDGSAQFPEKLVGEWIGSGYMINDAGHATGGVWVFSTRSSSSAQRPGPRRWSARATSWPT